MTAFIFAFLLSESIQLAYSGDHFITPGDYIQQPHKKDVEPNSPVFFQIAEVDRKLFLKLIAKNRQYHLSRSNSLLIQLRNNKPSFRIQPSVVISNDWPKDGYQIPLETSLVSLDSDPDSGNEITIEAHFTYCHRTTKVCTETVQTAIHYHYSD
jgi:hypothetical protein